MKTLPLLLLLLAATIASAAAAPSQPKCKAPANRQFDFWAGNWKVYDYPKATQIQGTNDITIEFDGCVLQEHWKSSDGSSGSSFNIYDRSRRVWHQTWVDTFGQLLLLEGGMKNGSMVLEGPGHRKDGKLFYNRITWTPLPDGNVRQHWERSPDRKTWSDVFDGLYKKIK